MKNLWLLQAKKPPNSPLKPSTVTNTHSPSFRFANFSHQRRSSVIISDFEFIETVVVNSKLSNDDNVVLSDVMKWKVSDKASICKEGVSDLSKNPRVRRSSNADKLYKELFGIPPLGHKASFTCKAHNTSASSSSKPALSNDETIKDLFTKFYHAFDRLNSNVPQHLFQNEPSLNSIPQPPFTASEALEDQSFVPDQSASVIPDQYRFYSTILDFISASLLPIITDVGQLYPKLIKEFIVNLPMNFKDHRTPEYQKVHVRAYSRAFRRFCSTMVF
ncbi:flocculation protein FLO11-like [Cucumis melo var. makuwa]|uniref:Flocculation protein FLO11-like n=1 Tax=Cucumis melo var. makuwa TaxID=1194695 RepID=A0A5A7TP88_CUCMM|nr:flocculation protein FLO11-like [Cucumis melo var. makuwa]